MGEQDVGAALDHAHGLGDERGDVAIVQQDGHELAGVEITITQAELASMLGVSRETVNKQLNQFARDVEASSDSRHGVERARSPKTKSRPII